LETSNKTLEELNGEDAEDDDAERHGEISLILYLEHDSQEYLSGLQYVGDGEYMYPLREYAAHNFPCQNLFF
jgi:hypothetical protein